MKNLLGVLGYTFLILGAFFIDTPIIALLFIPMFLAGVILLMIFYKGIFKRNIILGMFGILIICLTLGYSCIEFNQFLVVLSRDEFIGFTRSTSIKTGGVILLTLLASFLVFLGLGKENIHRKQGSLVGYWMSASFVLPFVILLYWIAYKTGNWLGG